MKKVCGTCNFQINSQAGSNGIETLCTYNNKWYKDSNPACDKWAEFNNALTNQDRINLITSSRQDERDLETNSLTREANKIARSSRDEALRANRIASKALITAIIATIIAIIAIIVNIKNP